METSKNRECKSIYLLATRAMTSKCYDTFGKNALYIHETVRKGNTDDPEQHGFELRGPFICRFLK